MMCCEDMKVQASISCPDHDRCPDQVIAFNDFGLAKGLYIHDGGYSYYTIYYCPFCGSTMSMEKDRYAD